MATLEVLANDSQLWSSPTVEHSFTIGTSPIGREQCLINDKRLSRKQFSISITGSDVPGGAACAAWSLRKRSFTRVPGP